MSEKQNAKEVDLYQSRRVEQALSKLPKLLLSMVEDEIDKIVLNPELGELKKGDLSFLHVHKFKLVNRLMLLGYSWVAANNELYLLGVGSHENFYQEQKKHRKFDLKLIG